MTLNQAGIDLIKDYEKCKLDAYPDLNGIPTIGWGTTGPEIHLGMAWTQEQCDKVLKADLDSLQYRLNRLFTRLITDNQFAACCCLAYNIGVGNFKSSSLLKLLNMNQVEMAADEFLKWDHSRGKVVPGLLNRRLDEQKLFNS